MPVHYPALKTRTKKTTKQCNCSHDLGVHNSFFRSSAIVASVPVPITVRLLLLVSSGGSAISAISSTSSPLGKVPVGATPPRQPVISTKSIASLQSSSSPTKQRRSAPPACTYRAPLPSIGRTPVPSRTLRPRTMFLRRPSSTTTTDRRALGRSRSTTP